MLVDEWRSAGKYIMQRDAKDIPGGMLFYMPEAENRKAVRKLGLME